jgi:hypothetical protein
MHYAVINSSVLISLYYTLLHYQVINAVPSSSQSSALFIAVPLPVFSSLSTGSAATYSFALISAVLEF